MRSFIPISLIVAGACVLTTLAVLEEFEQSTDDVSQVPLVKAKMAIMTQRAEAVEDLLAGRRTFAETANRFKQLTGEDPTDSMRWLKMIYPDCCDEELYYRHVILYTETQLRQRCGDMSFSDELRQQLEELKRNGFIADSPVSPAGEEGE
jgi:hypothetical protein